ncbi:MAG TPA: Asp-tRNA(Asn)/Glu-tRNA(Gln) amidotransferase subunit GatB [Burkholderiales bacterium]|nr:Asp-tRNA(Asn)/Glu-tRNA(Gln) amidotransferase subunit GatB [Burkholderiales bacterium]
MSTAWEIVVGIETHTQLLTKSKMFSGASTTFGAPPNSQASSVDIALPGVLPVVNRAAVECAIKFGLAVDGKINPRSIFARKNYFYPDLPKGYQISQFEIPIVQGGQLKIGEKMVRLTRAHLEEDAGKSLHEGRDTTGIDLNRAGTPLLEIVSEPDLRGAAEAVAYARELHALVVWIGVCDGNMQEGSFRCDANVSVRNVGEQKLGTRCELKNLNSFRFMEQAIEFEAKRQIEILEDGGKIVQETRLYDPERDETRSMRTKEDAHDYRYFPDPDLLPLVISTGDIERIRAGMTKPPKEKRRDYVAMGLEKQADMLVSSRQMAEYFDAASSSAPESAVATLANWIVGPLSARLNEEKTDISRSKISPLQLSLLAQRVSDGTVSNSTAVGKVLPAMWEEGAGPDDVIEKLGLKQVSDAAEIEKLVDAAIAAGAKQVADYKAGKEKALQSLVGQVMKASKGKANPAQVNEILRRKLGG